MVDRKIQAVAKVSIGAVHPIGIDDSVDFAVGIEIAVWLLQCDHSVAADFVNVAVGRTIAVNSKLEGFHGLCDIPVIE